MSELTREIFEEFREEFREVKHLLRCHPERRDRLQRAAFGQGKVEQMAFSISPGQTKTLSVVFTDNSTPPVSHPLSAVPTASDTTGVATVTAVGTPTPTDASYNWTIACPASAVVGSSLSITVTGINPDGVADTDVYPIGVLALDDTLQTATLT